MMFFEAAAALLTALAGLFFLIGNLKVNGAESVLVNIMGLTFAAAQFYAAWHLASGL